MSRSLPSGVAGQTQSRVHRLDPRTKTIVLVGLTFVAVSAPLAAWPTFLACAAVLGALSWTARVPLGVLLGRSRIVLLPVGLMVTAVPFVRSGGSTFAVGPLTAHEAGIAVAAAALIKAAIGTWSAVLLGATTSLPDVLHALERLRVPRLFVLVAALMHRYLAVLVGELRNMRHALAARCWRPRSALRAGAAGRVAGTMFVRAHARGERVHRAMLARGFNGVLPRRHELVAGGADVAFALGALGLVVAIRIATGVVAA